VSDSPHQEQECAGKNDNKDKGAESRFNSLLIVDQTGKMLMNYHKRFLYYTDETWAGEGQNGAGFLSLPIQTGKSSILSGNSSTSTAHSLPRNVPTTPTQIQISTAKPAPRFRTPS
jgi:hypothetical protein